LPAEEILIWSGMVHPEKLETTKPSFKDGRGKDIELASQLENYYALRSKALLELGRYEECLILCSEALEKLDKFHYDNDVWFQRRMAQCQLHTGKITESEGLMNAVLTKKRDWFLSFETAEICLKLNKREEAIRHALQAILAWGDVDKKVRLLDFLACNFGEELTEIAPLCTRLEYKIRVENGWRTGDALLVRMQRIGGAEVTSDSVSSLTASLKSQAQSKLETSAVYLKGRLKSMLSTGMGGFIETSDGISYYFKTSDYRGRKEELTPGMNLRFQPGKGFDRKKNRESDIALKVERIL
jgi:tetratricopeptide (TPR) repeat protein